MLHRVKYSLCAVVAAALLMSLPPAIQSQEPAAKTEAAKTEAQPETKAETPKVETPKAETPKVETPKAETPKAETPKAETPKAETPKVDTPKAETPKAESPKTDAAKTDAAKEASKEEPAKTEPVKTDDSTAAVKKAAADKATTEKAPTKIPEQAVVPNAGKAAAPATDVAADAALYAKNIVLILLVLVLPFTLGHYLAKGLRMNDYGWKFGLILFTLTASTAAVSTGKFRLGTDLKGGANLVYEVDHAKLKNSEAVDMEKLTAAITKRVNPSGLQEIVVRPVGGDQVEIILPEADEDEAARIEKIISSAGSLEFRILANTRDHQELIRASETPEVVVKDPGDERREIGRWVPIAVYPKNHPVGTPGGLRFHGDQNFNHVRERNGRTEVLVSIDEQNVQGQDLARVGEGYDDRNRPAVTFGFGPEGALRFGQLTGDNLPVETAGDRYQRQLGVVLNGELYAAPNIQARISDNGIIEGNFTSAEVRDYVSTLQAGHLPTALAKEPISRQVTGPTLGQDTIDKGTMAIGGSMIAVLCFMILYYHWAGVIADFVLMLNLLLTLAVMMLVSAVFTLPGIAGLVLTVGMAVDANVLIFERMREELARGAAFRMAIRNGFDRATTAIVDSNLTTLITAAVLYWIGTDQVKGFAVTLFIGISLSMFTAVFVARVIFDVLERKRILTTLTMTELIPVPNFDWLAVARPTIIASVVVIGLGVACVVARGKNVLDIDFTGGSSVQIVFAPDAVKAGKTPTISEIRDKVSADPQNSLPDATVKNIRLPDEPDGTRFVIDSSLQDKAEMEKRLVALFPGLLDHNEATIESLPADKPLEADVVGPRKFALKLAQKMNEPAVREKLTVEAKALDIPETFKVTAPGYEEGSNKAYPEWTLTVNSTAAQADALTTAFAKKLAATPFFPSSSVVGGQVAAATCYLALAAIILSLAAIVGYLWFRFHKPMFGIAAVVAVLHDVAVATGALAASYYLAPVLGWALVDPFKINLTIVAALLTIIGYSLNDTIVIFDRIREIRGKSPDLTPAMINSAVNQTLSRTILTTFTTLLVVVVLYVWGGEGLRAFSYTLLVGMVAGVYSTVFIASPVLIWLHEYGVKAANRERTNSRRPVRAGAEADA